MINDDVSLASVSLASTAFKSDVPWLDYAVSCVTKEFL